MGCGSSKAAKNVVAPAEFSPKNVNIVDVSQRKASDPIVDDEMKSKHRKLSRDSLKDSCGSSKSSREDIRKNSSSLQDTSKSVQRGQSAKSNDSGLGDYDDEKQIITEETKLNEKGVKELEIRPATPELIISGSTFKKKKSSSSKAVLPEIKRFNSLVSPQNMNSNKNKITPSKGGMAFDIILAPDTNNKKRRPNQLPALESRHTKRKEITKQELEAKQKAAMERRKHHEKKLIAKATAYKERDKKVHDALQKFAEQQTKDTQIKLDNKLQQSAENRKAQLESLRKSFREREKRAKKVRQVKQQLIASNETMEN